MLGNTVIIALPAAFDNRKWSDGWKADTTQQLAILKKMQTLPEDRIGTTHSAARKAATLLGKFVSKMAQALAKCEAAKAPEASLKAAVACIALSKTVIAAIDKAQKKTPAKPLALIKLRLQEQLKALKVVVDGAKIDSKALFDFIKFRALWNRVTKVNTQKLAIMRSALTTLEALKKSGRASEDQLEQLEDLREDYARLKKADDYIRQGAAIGNRLDSFNGVTSLADRASRLKNLRKCLDQIVARATAMMRYDVKGVLRGYAVIADQMLDAVNTELRAH